MKNNYICYVPYPRNSIAYNHDFCDTCVKWWCLQGSFFQFFKIFIFQVARAVKGEKTVQNDQKNCLLHTISEKPSIIWLPFMVNICKMIISWSAFFDFWKILIFWVQKMAKGKKTVHSDRKLSVAFHISGTINHMIMIFWCTCIKQWYLSKFFYYLKSWFLGFFGVKGQKMT